VSAEPGEHQLSAEKSGITHIDKGFDFLSVNIRKYNGKLLIKPSKKNVKAFLDKDAQSDYQRMG
jgi:RNA-directed DNA polymerase